MNRHSHQMTIGGVFTYEVGSKQYTFLKSSDIEREISRGNADVGFVGSDKRDESRLSGRWSNLADEPVADPKCDMVFASDKRDICVPMGLNTLIPNARIATSYPFTAEDYFARQLLMQQPRVVVEPSGSVEAYVKFGQADIIVDIRETGSTLIANNLPYYKVMKPITTNLIWKSGETVTPELNVRGILSAVARIKARETDNVGTLTTRLLKDRNELVKKIGSEAAELVQAIAFGDSKEVVLESQDVLYAVAVALAASGGSLIDALNRI